jgi:hypothetical protein
MPPIDLSSAVIDGPDFSASLAEVPVEKPAPEEISLDLDTGDFDLEDGFAGFDASAKDDNLIQVIPEAFEIGAKEATLDDEPEDSIEASMPAGDISSGEESGISATFKGELRNVLSYMDHLLESLPEEKIEEFAKSEYFDTYKKIFKDLGLV